MSEYTPTTYQVRMWLTDAQVLEFDRWLARHDAELAKAAKVEERERLLELAKTTPMTLAQVIEHQAALEAIGDRIEAGEGA